MTSLVADYGRVASSGSNPANPEQIWIGGEDGFQLIDAVNGDELYDIENLIHCMLVTVTRLTWSFMEIRYTTIKDNLLTTFSESMLVTSVGYLP